MLIQLQNRVIRIGIINSQLLTTPIMFVLPLNLTDI